MTSLVDSSAHLNRRCKELELSESCSVALEGLGLTSLGRLAYAVGSPSESASEAQYQAWFEEHLPSTSIGDRSIVKRLVTEAETIVCAELREPAPQSGKCQKPNGRLGCQSFAESW